MTKRIHNVLWAVGLMASLAVVPAPASAAEIRCQIPFNFSIGGKTLPPGIYHVSTDRSVLFVRGLGHGAVALTNPVESGKDAGAKLVFYRSGDRYFLQQAWTGGVAGRELLRPRGEGQLASAERSGAVVVGFDVVVIPAL